MHIRSNTNEVISDVFYLVYLFLAERKVGKTVFVP